MNELEQQLGLVKKNRQERIDGTNEKLAEIQHKKNQIKNDIEDKVREHRECIKQVIQDLAEVKRKGDQDQEYQALMNDFMTVSGSIGAELLQDVEGMQQEAALALANE